MLSRIFCLIFQSHLLRFLNRGLHSPNAHWNHTRGPRPGQLNQTPGGIDGGGRSPLQFVKPPDSSSLQPGLKGVFSNIDLARLDKQALMDYFLVPRPCLECQSLTPISDPGRCRSC